MSIPEIRTQGTKQVLYVNDAPYFLLGGEVHNSDSSSPEYMEGIWDTAQGLGMNTLLLPVSWEMTEPIEGQFDFSVPQALIRQARFRSMHIVFLWFGSWKNAECMYAPAWVKQDLARFPRAQIEKGNLKAGRDIMPGIPVKFPYATLSYLGEETKACDARAFAAFMDFLRQFDGAEQTVLAVQVENETGLLGAAREVSDEADALFEGPVPEEFASYMKTHTKTMVEDVREAVEGGAASGSWAEVFGPVAEEIFSAYYVASYVEAVAAAGKAVYPLPMAANCWLDKGADPGSYPTGGPVSRVHEVWAFCAPSIGLLCPDIYVPNFGEICEEYTRRGGALFIPEAATHSYCAPRMVYTVGHHHAMCYSPFGFDDIGKPFSASQGFLFGMDVSDPALKTPQSFEEYGALARLLSNMMPLLAPAYGTDRLDALCAELNTPQTDPANPFAGGTAAMDFDGFRLEAGFASPMQPRADGCCLCLALSPNEIFVVGSFCSLRLSSTDEQKPHLDLLLCEEGTFENGLWRPKRRFNGDETAQLSLGAPGALHIRFFTYGNEV